MGGRVEEGGAPRLVRHFGYVQATALNITAIVGAGVFITIPLMLGELPGPYALLGWIAAAALMLVDGMIWAELGAALPGSGGSYRYLLECYGPRSGGRLMAFLFIWQFLISGPLEVSTALIAIAQFSQAASPEIAQWNEAWTMRAVLWAPGNIAVSLSPARLFALGVGGLILVLLHRRIAGLGRLTVTVWIGVMAALFWILVEGWLRFDPRIAFDRSGLDQGLPPNFAKGLGAAMILAMYSYLGYYNICYIGDEVIDPGKTIPRAIFSSAIAVFVLFVAAHLAMLGTIPWREVPTKPPEVDAYILPVEFMRRARGDWAGSLFALLLVWCCFGSALAALLGYSRIPFGAARFGHFFRVFGRLHPVYAIPHVSLWLVGGLTLLWSVFDLASVITAMIVTRILEQFLGQVVGVMLLRRARPDLPRPYRIWLYPLPCLLAGGGWLYVYLAAGALYILLGLATLAAGAAAYLAWARSRGGWPFGAERAPDDPVELWNSPGS